VRSVSDEAILRFLRLRLHCFRLCSSGYGGQAAKKEPCRQDSSWPKVAKWQKGGCEEKGVTPLPVKILSLIEPAGG